METGVQPATGVARINSVVNASSEQALNKDLPLGDRVGAQQALKPSLEPKVTTKTFSNRTEIPSKELRRHGHVADSSASFQDGEVIGGTAHFRNNSAVLQAQTKAMLNELLPGLKEAAKHGDVITLDGHASTVGDSTYNRQLSKRRAEAIKAYLVSHGIDADRIKINHHGEDKPITKEVTATDQAANRRVAIGVERAAAVVPAAEASRSAAKGTSVAPSSSAQPYVHPKDSPLFNQRRPLGGNLFEVKPDATLGVNTVVGGNSFTAPTLGQLGVLLQQSPNPQVSVAGGFSLGNHALGGKTAEPAPTVKQATTDQGGFFRQGNTDALPDRPAGFLRFK